MTQLTISMPAALQSWVESRISEGAYANAADYVRDLVRRDQAASAERQWVKAMVDEGLRSGVIDRDPREIIAELIAEDPDLRD
jgi:antitoxin ParD1/3/4